MDGAFPAAPGHLVNPKASQTVYINCFMFYYPAGTSGRTERNLVRWLAASFLMLVVEPSHSWRTRPGHMIADLHGPQKKRKSELGKAVLVSYTRCNRVRRCSSPLGLNERNLHQFKPVANLVWTQ